MDGATLTILAVIGILLTLFAHVWWEMSHDTKPRDPYRK